MSNPEECAALLHEPVNDDQDSDGPPDLIMYHLLNNNFYKPAFNIIAWTYSCFSCIGVVYFHFVDIQCYLFKVYVHTP